MDEPKLPKKIEGLLAERKRGTLQDKADELGVDPFEVILLIAGNCHKQLGLKSPTMISPSLRLAAAAEACRYMHPQLKSVEFSGSVDVNETKRHQMIVEILQMTALEAQQEDHPDEIAAKDIAAKYGIIES